MIHSGRGVQFTSWAFSSNVRDAGLAPSMGAVGSAYDNAMVESFWGRLQVELLNRKRWTTRIELATAIHDYIELFHNTRRRRETPRSRASSGIVRSPRRSNRIASRRNCSGYGGVLGTARHPLRCASRHSRQMSTKAGELQVADDELDLGVLAVL